MKQIRLLIIMVALAVIFTGCAQKVQRAEAKSQFATVVGEPRINGWISIHNQSNGKVKMVLSNTEKSGREAKIITLEPGEIKVQQVSATDLAKVEVDASWYGPNGAPMAKPLPLAFNQEHTASIEFTK